MRREADGLAVSGVVVDTTRETRLHMELQGSERTQRVDGRSVRPGEYAGRLEAVVYATDRLRAVRGPMRERRAFLDRQAAALWPTYRSTLSAYERVLRQRNAALERGSSDLEAWDERLAEEGGDLRARRAGYAQRLRSALEHAFRPAGERYDVVVPGSTVEADERARLRAELRAAWAAERRARRSLAGPHRDEVRFLVQGDDAAESASSGQVRSLLLALAQSALEVYRAERGTPPVALLDDLDSELDEERATRFCREVASGGQGLVTTSHPAWARRLAEFGRLFLVEEGRVVAA